MAEAINCGGIGHAPMRRHRLSRPHGTHFLCGVVANCEDKVQLGSARLGEFAPILASQTTRRKVEGTPEQIEKAFREAFMILDRRISLLLCLPLSSLDKLAIQKEIDRI
jgi:hypothetical protein